MLAQPQDEHRWLEQLLGRWDMHHDCVMPDGSSSVTNGKIDCRSLGGMWVLVEYSGESPEGKPWSSVMTLGFDPAKDCYVGSFVGSMMSNIWNYTGKRAAGEDRLVLDTVGPAFDGSGTCNYRDTIEIVDANAWRLISAMQNEDGSWTQFMNGTHSRI